MKNHQRSCTKSADQMVHALAKAREGRPPRKRRRLEVRDYDVAQVDEPVGSMVCAET